MNGFEDVLPRKLTCPLKFNGWKMYFLLKWSLLRGLVSFQGCISFWDGLFSGAMFVSGRVTAGTQFHGGLVQIMTSVLFMGDDCRFQQLIFQGVNYPFWGG